MDKINQMIKEDFEKDYEDIKSILAMLLPVIKQYGWQYHQQVKLYGKKEDASPIRVNVMRLEQQICNHHFRDNQESYERRCSDLINLSLWYASLRDFFQKWGYRKGETIQRLHKDFGELLEKEDEGLLEDYVKNPAL